MSALARLSFWVPAARMGEFETAYAKKLASILKKHDLIQATKPGRAAVEGIFSRLFELESPAEIAAREQALHKDATWWKALRDLGKIFGTTFAATHPDGVTPDYRGYYTADMIARMDPLLRYHLGPYAAPAGAGRAVEAGMGFRQGAWHNFSVPDGLPDSVVQQILEDREGRLWFATRGAGVCRYDSVEFITFTEEDGLAGDDVPAMLEDRAGRLWFGTHRGCCRYDGQEFVIFTTADGLAENEISCMLEDRAGHLWFGTFGGGVSRYDGRKFVNFTVADGLAENNVRSILEDRAGHLWFGTKEGGVSRCDGQEFTTFTTADGLGHNRVNCMLEDRQGYLWFGTGQWEVKGGGGASRYDGQEFVNFTTADGLGFNEVWSILEDRVGHLWFGTFGGGVSRYDGRQFTTSTVKDGLGFNEVTSVTQDRLGRLWFGTWEGGVSRYAEAEFHTFTEQDGLVGERIGHLVEDREGCIWLGMGTGLGRYDGERISAVEEMNGQSASPLLEDRQGHLWWWSKQGEGIRRYDGHQFATFTEEHGLAHNWVMCMVEDQQGRLWFGTTESGVCCYDGVEFATFTEEHGLAHNWVMCAARDRQGCLWFGTRSGGASRYDGHQFTTFTTEDGLADNMVNHILTDQKGHVWFATDGGGVSRYDGRQFTTFTTRDGLAHNRVRYIMQDRDGHLWFGTRGGGANIYDGLVFQKLTRQDGLAHDGVKQILQDGRGDFLLATLGGLTRYRPQGIPPTLRLKDVIVDRRYGPVSEIQLPTVQHLLTFEFQGVSWTTRPDGMAYVYRLEGYDAEWQTTRTRRVAYADLALGEYTFQVKAVDRDLNYSEPATVRVSVRPDPRIAALNEALSTAGASSEFVGKSPALLRFQEQMAEVAPTEVTVLVSGETGTGKGLGARIIHGLSPRKGGPFIQVNCGAIPENLVESELFGHERGAFTGAIARKLGKVELADGGTLFLDEIGDLPLAAQVKLLQLVDERTFERVGGTETLKPDVRIVAATNRDLQEMVHAGQFRGDLYFRLQVFPVQLPPLRQRRADIPLLALYFMERMAAHLHKGVTHLAPESLSALQAYDWPGNVRELEHAVQRAVIVCRGATIQARDISLGSAVEDSVEEFVTLEAYERRYISRVLQQTGWVIGGGQGAAAILGLNESTLRGRLRKLGIERPNNRD